MGLLQENTGVAAQVLLENGVDARKVMDVIKDLIAPGNDLLLKEKNGYSKRAKQVLEESGRQATRFGSELIGTEHLLMSIIKEGDNVAVRLLNTMGFSTQKICVDLLLAMGQDANLYKGDLAHKNTTKRKKEDSALEQYSRDLTALAREGKLDPVIGREEEIGTNIDSRQME